MLHLNILNSLLDVKSFEGALSGAGPALSADIASYLLHRGFYHHIATAFSHIVGIPLTTDFSASTHSSKCGQPFEAKTTPSIPLLIVLSTSQFGVLSSPTFQFVLALKQFTTNILTISLLPNRLPLPSVSYLSAHIPFDSMALLDLPEVVGSLATSQLFRTHLLANLLAFGPPRLPNAFAPTLDMYLTFLSALMDSLPTGCLEPISHIKQSTSWTEDPSSSDDDDTPHVNTMTRKPSEASTVHPPLDSKTQARLHTLHSPAHIMAILLATQRHPQARSRVFKFMTSLWAVWPARRDRVVSAVIGGGPGAGLVREVWRGHVRGSSLGKEEDAKRAVEAFTSLS
jgi:ubiquitin-protein ligase E3 C